MPDPTLPVSGRNTTNQEADAMASDGTGEVHRALHMARRARTEQRMASPHSLYNLAGGDTAVYRHAMLEAGLVWPKDADGPEDPCSVCGWSPSHLLRDIVAAARRECDGSGGFGPPKDSGLLGWRACPGCARCKP